MNKDQNKKAGVTWIIIYLQGPRWWTKHIFQPEIHPKNTQKKVSRVSFWSISCDLFFFKPNCEIFWSENRGVRHDVEVVDGGIGALRTEFLRQFCQNHFFSARTKITVSTLFNLMSTHNINRKVTKKIIQTNKHMPPTTLRDSANFISLLNPRCRRRTDQGPCRLALHTAALERQCFGPFGDHEHGTMMFAMSFGRSFLRSSKLSGSSSGR